MSRWLVLPILFFLASSFALLYISSHFPLFSAYACSPFSFRYAFYCCCSFALPGSWNSPWMPWLTPCPNCFPTASNFFFFFPLSGRWGRSCELFWEMPFNWAFFYAPDLMPNALMWSWCNNHRNKVHDKCKTLESSLNHPNLPPYLCTPVQWRNYFPQN